MLAILTNNEAQMDNHPSINAGYKTLMEYVKQNRPPETRRQNFILTADIAIDHKVACFDGYPVHEIRHDPDESCQACGSYHHNTWCCPNSH